ncbi:Glycosyltransferase involved in cell wall bisynthesis [Amphibacillus marinus]|uniref:Glycosyltransferase involved in cell wall bisynthesis n=1 Tax=Amphibacillus marinus TaxID=872970 RepID=A0A1H8IUH1_9BACI|nr:glycosyltransferase family 1 protein [Amphibacillus marinus]SEN72293.1 Glycosyltransferase involved in cell wall bisynthesis [Amphibacillus marinus]
MKIAIFTDTFAPEVNGVAVTLERYLTYLKRKGISYRLFAPSSAKAISTEPDVQRLTSIPFLLYRNCRFTLPIYPHIKKELDKFRPDLIHIVTPFNLGLIGLHYGKSQNIPIVASYHTHFDHYLDYYRLSYFKKWLQKYLAWFHQPIRRIYVPSVETKMKLTAQQFHPQIEVWSRGVDHIYFTPKKRHQTFIREKYQITAETILLYVGRIAPEKEIEIVLKTFAALPDQVRQHTHLIIAGDGPLLSPLSKKKKKNVTWTGFVKGEALATLYASSDIFLFPSSSETFGNVVLEAMASGLPIIGANSGGVKNLVQDGVNGFLCDAKQVEQFTNKTLMLIEKKLLRAAMAQSARNFAKAQSWDTIFNNLINSLYDIQFNSRIRELHPIPDRIMT